MIAAEHPEPLPPRASLTCTQWQDVLAAARNHGCVADERLGRWRYARFTDSFRGLPEGSVVLGDTVVYGYPKIGRIVCLDSGIRAQFEQPFWVEEKIDGYNVRIITHAGQVLALTRRGYLCPFTTDRVHDLIDTRVFATRPELVLCAEVAGPDNPYTEARPPDIGADVRLYGFDLMRKDQPGFLPYAEKIRLLTEHNLPSVPQYGLFQPGETARLTELLLELDRSGREGVVLKENSARDWRAKYVTGRINLADIQVVSMAIKQLPAEYFTQRILRLALFLDEHGLARTPALYQELGETLIEGVIAVIDQLRREHKVMHRFCCRFRRKRYAVLFLHAQYKLLGKGNVQLRRLERTGDFYELEFAKVLPRATGLFAHLLSGGIVFD